ncbi:hypothetical protein AWB71_06046 [Caballeronia peredens]|nr:hypothetical protein AWB71_06046 [Caballeronia peredens]
MALDLTNTAKLFVSNITTAVKGTTTHDLTTLKGFSEQQLDSLARQSALVAGMIEANEFTDDERDFFLIGLQNMANSFVHTLIGMIEVEIEKIYNAIVKAIYDSISSLARVALAVPVPV